MPRDGHGMDTASDTVTDNLRVKARNTVGMDAVEDTVKDLSRVPNRHECCRR